MEDIQQILQENAQLKAQILLKDEQIILKEEALLRKNERILFLERLSPLGKAISYAFGMWPRVSRYCKEGYFNIDNNGV